MAERPKLKLPQLCRTMRFDEFVMPALVASIHVANSSQMTWMAGISRAMTNVHFYRN
jgi:hypothetical protein